MLKLLAKIGFGAAAAYVLLQNPTIHSYVSEAVTTGTTNFQALYATCIQYLGTKLPLMTASVRASVVNSVAGLKNVGASSLAAVMGYFGKLSNLLFGRKAFTSNVPELKYPTLPYVPPEPQTWTEYVQESSRYYRRYYRNKNLKERLEKAIKTLQEQKRQHGLGEDIVNNAVVNEIEKLQRSGLAFYDGEDFRSYDGNVIEFMQ